MSFLYLVSERETMRGSRKRRRAFGVVLGDEKQSKVCVCVCVDGGKSQSPHINSDQW